MDNIANVNQSLEHQSNEYGTISLDNYKKSFEQLKLGLMSVSLDISPEDIDVMKTLLRRLDLIPHENIE